MKNMKFLFILLLACPQIKAAALENDFLLNCLISMKASKALQDLVGLQEKKSADKPAGKEADKPAGKEADKPAGKEADKTAGPGSTFVSWLNPTRYASGVDQNNEAVKHLNKIETAIQEYYDNSVWFGQSTGNTKKQAEAKANIEKLVAEYKEKLDDKNADNHQDFVAYKSTFEDMIKDAQSQFSNLNLETAQESLLQPMINYFASFLSSKPATEKARVDSNPLGSNRNNNTEQNKPATPADKKADKPAGAATEEESKAQDAQALLQKMRDALAQANTFDVKITAKQSEIEAAILDNDDSNLEQLKIQKAQLQSDKANSFVPLFKEYVEKFGSFNEEKNRFGRFDRSITSKEDKKQPIVNDSELRKILGQAKENFKNDNLKISLGSNGYQVSLDGLIDDVKNQQELNL